MGRFEIDSKGLAKTVEGQPKSRLVYELVSNAYDEADVTKVNVTIATVTGRPEVILTVEDDSPTGFAKLSDAYTMFAPSYKAVNPDQRGRWCVGEKFVVAASIEAEISTTKGTIQWTSDERSESRRKTSRGSKFTGRFRMTRDEYDEVLHNARMLISPPWITTTINGVALLNRVAIAEFNWQLPTMLGDRDGVLRPSKRQAAVRFYEPLPGEQAHLYELGIPVVETGDRWHVDVRQKVPLNRDRDNVPPSFLKLIRTLTLNAMHDRLAADEFTAPWVNEAVQDEQHVEPAAVKGFVRATFGDKPVSVEPGERGQESMRMAVAAGHTPIHGRSLSRATWSVIRENDLVPSASKLFPTPGVSNDWEQVAFEDAPVNYQRAAAYAKALAPRLIDASVKVSFIKGATIVPAEWRDGGCLLTLNIATLGPGFFERGATEDVNDLFIHEFAHHYGHHLETSYMDALSRLGAKLAELALTEREFFYEWRSDVRGVTS